MKDWKEVISSGILNSYVLNLTTEEENLYIEHLSSIHPEIRQERLEIELAFEAFAMAHAIEPAPIIRPFLLAGIDFSERRKAGEALVDIPVLHEQSKASDYSEFLDRADMVLPEDFNGVFARIIGNTPEMSTSVVWISGKGPAETHENEIERFLILEGTCEVHIEEDIINLKGGDYIQIPLYRNHWIEVTSAIPCKAILQRVAI